MDDHLEEVTEVWIYNRKYCVRGTDPEYVRRLARYLDERMSQVTDSTATVDSLKVAVLTALNIADDFFSARESLEKLQQELEVRTERLIGQMEPLLDQSVS